MLPIQVVGVLQPVNGKPNIRWLFYDLAQASPPGWVLHVTVRADPDFELGIAFYQILRNPHARGRHTRISIVPTKRYFFKLLDNRRRDNPREVSDRQRGHLEERISAAAFDVAGTHRACGVTIGCYFDVNLTNIFETGEHSIKVIEEKIKK